MSNFKRYVLLPTEEYAEADRNAGVDALYMTVDLSPGYGAYCRYDEEHIYIPTCTIEHWLDWRERAK